MLQHNCTWCHCKPLTKYATKKDAMNKMQRGKSGTQCICRTPYFGWVLEMLTRLKRRWPETKGKGCMLLVFANGLLSVVGPPLVRLALPHITTDLILPLKKQPISIPLNKSVSSPNVSWCKLSLEVFSCCAVCQGNNWYQETLKD